VGGVARSGVEVEEKSTVKLLKGAGCQSSYETVSRARLQKGRQYLYCTTESAA